MVNENITKNEHYIAIPPGYTLKEQLKQENISQKALAERTGISEKHISNIIKGKAPISRETSIKLEKVLGVPASFWNNLENIYRDKLAKIKEEEEMKKEFEILKEIPYAQMVKLGWIEHKKKAKDKVKTLCSFFKVSSLFNIPNVSQYSMGFRRQRVGNEYATYAWIRKGILDSEIIDTKPFSEKKLRKNLENFRKMTTKSPTDFQRNMTCLASECGIALVFLPHLYKTYSHGHTTKLSSKKIIVQLSLRNKYLDEIWFSFFHELGHILNNDFGKVYSEYEENRANKFAQDILIPFDEYTSFIENNILNEKSIEIFSEKINIDKGIVVGRLHHDKIIPYNYFNNLRKKYNLDQ